MSQELKEKIQQIAYEKYQGSYKFFKEKNLKNFIGEDDYNIIYNSVSEELRTSKSLMVRCFMEGITENPRCECCGENVKFNDATKKFAKYCSNKCRIQNIQDSVDIRKETNIEKYGVTNYLMTSEGKEKRKNTFKIKYGTTTPTIKDIKRYTTDDIVVKFREKHGDRYDYFKFIYKGRHEKSIIICEEHGDFLMSSTHHIKGSGCPTCAGVPKGGFKRKNTREFIEELSKYYKKYNHYDFSKFEYVNNRTNGLIVCPEHGNFYLTPKQLLRQHGYSECSGKKKLTLEDIRKRMDVIHGIGTYIIPEQEYVNNKTKIEIICPIHGSWYVRPDNLLNSEHRCPSCAGSVSKIEAEMAEFVKELDPNIECGSYGFIPPLQIDVLSHSKKIAIEMNGLYCHGELGGSKDKWYHIGKTRQCEELGYNLLHIFEDEWRNKKDIWKSMIKYKFGKCSNTTYARKCEIRQVDNSDASSFLNDNHLQGYSKCSVRLGLYYNNELICLITFVKSRFDKSFEWEISRFATKINHSVVGGFDKLMKYFINNHNPNSIVTYADKRYSNGDLYRRHQGMVELPNDAINYYYFNKHEMVRYSRQKFQKHKLNELLPHFDESLTEWENMILHKYDRIWDCGNYKFAWYKNEETRGSSAPRVSDLTCVTA